MKSFTFLVALGVAAVAGWGWFQQSGDPRPPFPRYGIIAVSYAGGFLIGRVFWRIVKTAALLAALLLGGLAMLHYARVDTAKAKQAVTDGFSGSPNSGHRSLCIFLSSSTSDYTHSCFGSPCCISSSPNKINQ